MNKIHRLVWSVEHQAHVPVAETARSRGQRAAAVITLAAVSAFGAMPASATPSGGQVVSGSGSIAGDGTVTTVSQASDRLVIDWRSFNIAGGEAVHFVQPSSSSVALNRVTGGEASSIFGSLRANGQVFLINPNGVLF